MNDNQVKAAWIAAGATVLAAIIGLFSGGSKTDSTKPVNLPSQATLNSVPKSQYLDKERTETTSGVSSSAQAARELSSSEIINTPSIPEIVTKNEEERPILPGTTTSFFQGDIRVTVVRISEASNKSLKVDAKLAGDTGIKRISGEVGDKFKVGQFNEYTVSVAELYGSYTVFNIKKRELTTKEITEKTYPGGTQREESRQ